MKQEEKTKLTKERIIAAAMEEFGTNGYAGTTLNNILTKAGIAKGLFYHNYQSKEEIYLCCIKNCMDEMTAYLKQQNIGSDLEMYIKARLQFFQTHSRESRLFLEAVMQPPAALRAEIREQKKEFDEFNLALYGKILEELPLREGVTKEEAAAYFHFMQNMFNVYFSSPDCYEMSFSERMAAHEAYLPKILEFMLYGMAEKRNEG